jgi:DNA-binding transcriptional regulator/RsmH inhibitor MraZ
MLAVIGDSEQICFVGMFQRFQLWNPADYARQEHDAKARLKTNMPRLILPPSEGS